MTGARATRRCRPSRWAAAGLILLGLAALAGAVWWWYAPGMPAPPDVALAGAEPELADAVRAARGRVLREPRSAGAWGTLGELLMANDYPAEADVCLARAEDLDPVEPSWPYLRAWGLLAHDRGAGVAELRRAVERSEHSGRDDSSPYLLLVEVYVERDDRDQVEALCGRVLEREPGNARAHFDLGLIALTHDDLDAGIDHLLRAAESPYVRQHAYTRLAAAYQRRGDDDKAAEYARRAREAPDDAPWPEPTLDAMQDLAMGREARFRRGHQLTAQGRLPEAADWFRRMTADDPSDGRALAEWGVLLARMGRFAEAEEALRTAAPLDPRSAEVPFNLSVALYREGEQRLHDGDTAAETFRAAADAARKATAMKPDHALAHLFLGLALEQLGRRTEAIESFRTALRCRPENFEIHLALGEALAKDGQRDEAVVHLRRACDLAPPDDPRPREALKRWGETLE